MLRACQQQRQDKLGVDKGQGHDRDISEGYHLPGFKASR